MTDFGTRDSYVASMKGVLLSRATSPALIDLTHEIEPQNILEASFFLQASVPYFPLGTVFLCVVDPGVGTRRKILVAKASGRFFVAPDNGLLWNALSGSNKSQIYILDESKIKLPGPISTTFHGRDLMAPAAALIASGISPAKLGRSAASMVRLDEPSPETTAAQTTGEIIYFDRFGNGITNIKKIDLPPHGTEAKVKCRSLRIGKISRTYGETGKIKKTFVALWNSMDRLEIARPCGSAKTAANLRKGDRVILHYGNK